MNNFNGLYPIKALYKKRNEVVYIVAFTESIPDSLDSDSDSDTYAIVVEEDKTFGYCLIDHIRPIDPRLKDLDFSNKDI